MSRQRKNDSSLDMCTNVRPTLEEMKWMNKDCGGATWPNKKGENERRKKRNESEMLLKPRWGESIYT